ncbi:MAG: hypothetical protein EBY04_05395, partial [Actinobacteria bacterium]|nr:hypothetical protein [Actinomycetota bacterium]
VERKRDAKSSTQHQPLIGVGQSDADQGLVLGAALGVTFPFNLVLGIPLYAELASRLA